MRASAAGTNRFGAGRHQRADRFRDRSTRATVKAVFVAVQQIALRRHWPARPGASTRLSDIEGRRSASPRRPFEAGYGGTGAAERNQIASVNQEHRSAPRGVSGAVGQVRSMR